MNDLISRQQAIETALTYLVEYCGAAFDEDMQRMLKDQLDSLPSAQPVLTCKGCKYDYYEYAGCRNCLRRERDLYEPE